jgi:DNA-binding XRE family transcriptional regulator
MPKKVKKPKQPLHNLRAWREHFEMTQEQLADEVGTKKAVISLLESGDRGLSDKWARRLAPKLGPRGIKPGWLLDYTPEDFPGDLLETWGNVPEERRQHAIDVLKTYRKKGT